MTSILANLFFISFPFHIPIFLEHAPLRGLHILWPFIACLHPSNSLSEGNSYPARYTVVSLERSVENRIVYSEGLPLITWSVSNVFFFTFYFSWRFTLAVYVIFNPVTFLGYLEDVRQFFDLFPFLFLSSSTPFQSGVYFLVLIRTRSYVPLLSCALLVLPAAG
jgi:hypothetical protein